MTGLSDNLLHQLSERARDPRRRYESAAEDDMAEELTIGEVDNRTREWTEDLVRRAAEQSSERLSQEELERRVKASMDQRQSILDRVLAQRSAWGHPPPTSLSFIQSEGHIGASTRPPGATALPPPADIEDWEFLQRTTALPIPPDLRQLYGIADGGFGPGFQGLYSVRQIATNCLDLRRRGPDYCNSIGYPQSYLPIAESSLTYHYDTETGLIISSNQNWANEDLDPEDILQVAFQSLAEMMESWLARS